MLLLKGIKCSHRAHMNFNTDSQATAHSSLTRMGLLCQATCLQVILDMIKSSLEHSETTD